MNCVYSSTHTLPNVEGSAIMETVPLSHPALEGVDWVYYLWRDERIKIGTTRHLAKRMAALRPESILAIEPGDRVTESARHRKFRRERILGESETEWFRPSARLHRHINRIASKYPVPTAPSFRMTPRNIMNMETNVPARLPHIDTAPLPVMRVVNRPVESLPGNKSILSNYWPILFVAFAIASALLAKFVVGPYIVPLAAATIIVMFYARQQIRVRSWFRRQEVKIRELRSAWSR